MKQNTLWTESIRESTGQFGRCFETHKPLELGGFKVYGGNCANPMVTNADIYIGFDSSHKERYPWSSKALSLYYPIQDMGVPKDPDDFKQMIEWMVLQLTAGLTIHCGCIGGHGRTGLVLSALTSVMIGEPDAITYVRQNYCEKAVESHAQVEFLHKHFGITKQKGHKEHAPVTHHHAQHHQPLPYPTKGGKHAADINALNRAPVGMPKGEAIAFPTKSQMNIWGSGVQFDKRSQPATMV
jgi:hypothetical protein